MSLEDKRNKLNEQLEALKLFPDNNQIRILRSRINRQLESIEERERLEAIEVIPTKEELEEFVKLNKNYKKKFNFPFIIAVSGKNKSEILDNFRKRIKNDKNTEFKEAIRQVKKIASLRLKQINNN